jgi:SAM-dependent methyltransferase
MTTKKQEDRMPTIEDLLRLWVLGSIQFAETSNKTNNLVVLEKNGEKLGEKAREPSEKIKKQDQMRPQATVLLDDQESVLKEIYRVLKPNGVLSFSDHHLKEDAILSMVTNGKLFNLSRKGEKTYSFTKTERSGYLAN